MSDVGRLAGVSHQTVSRVINGSPNVRPETRRRVIAAMRELGYRPNSVARALVTGRTNTLGVVGFDTTLYGPASTLFGIERAAHEAGYFMIVASLRALNRASVADAIERLRIQGVDGILVIAPDLEAADALAARAGRRADGRRRGRAGGRGAGGGGRSVRRRGQRHPAPARTSGTRTVWHISGPVGLAGVPRAHRRLAGDPRGRPGSQAPPLLAGRLERARRATTSGGA